MPDKPEIKRALSQGTKTLMTEMKFDDITVADICRVSAVIESAADAISMVFEPVTMQTVKIAANHGVDPDAPAAPDPTPTPEEPTPTPGGLTEWIRQIISAFVRSLFESVARLFNH